MKPLFSTLARSLAVGTFILSLAACSNMTDTQQRTLSGAGIGAGVGAAGAAVTGGSPIGGAAIGAAAGAAGGYIYDQSKE